MSKDNLIILGVAGAALLLIFKMTRKTSSSSSAFVTSAGGPLNGSKAQPGWQYYSDGTSIDPQGNYYLNGELVWVNTNNAF